MSEKLLTVSEAANLLRLDPQTVRIWLRSGKLRGLRTAPGRNGQWRIKESEVNEALAPHTPNAD